MSLKPWSLEHTGKSAHCYQSMSAVAVLGAGCTAMRTNGHLYRTARSCSLSSYLRSGCVVMVIQTCDSVQASRNEWN